MLSEEERLHLSDDDIDGNGDSERGGIWEDGWSFRWRDWAYLITAVYLYDPFFLLFIAFLSTIASLLVRRM